MGNKKIEFGRSLVEMLGVLAIIGILSIAALMSYSYAIDKHKTNLTLDEVTKRHTVLFMQYAKDQPLNQDEFGSLTILGFPVTAELVEGELQGYKITLTQVPQGVCNEILKSNYPALLIVNAIENSLVSSTCQTYNTIDFLFNADQGWCERLDEQGNCCDKQGNCCPPDKPLLNSSNQCVSCEGDQSIHLGAQNIYTCSRCQNRKASNYFCAKMCPDGQVKDDSGNCHTCDEAIQYYLDKDASNVAAAFACPSLTVSTDGQKLIARHCELSNTVFGVHDYPQTCAKCDNRYSLPLTDKGVLCAKKCSDNQVMDTTGNCHGCNEVSTYYVFQIQENLIAAQSCPKLVFRDISNRLYAQHCDLADQSLIVAGHAETCSKCDNRDLVISTSNPNCALKCPAGQVRDTDGHCHSCDYVGQYYVEKTAENIAAAESCPRLTLRDIDTRLFAQHCEVSTVSLPVTGHTDSCLKCDNRVLKGQYCDLK